MLGHDDVPILKLRRTKIVATIGFASNTEKTLAELICAGVNVCRLNFSHGTHESHLQVIQNIRRVSRLVGIEVAILGDLCGPKIRVGEFEKNHLGKNEIFLGVDEEVTIVTDDILGRKGVIPSQYEMLIQDIKVGQGILLDDGKMELKVLSIDSNSSATCRVIRGGILKEKKGMNIPGSALSVPAVTEKDIEDLKFCIFHNVDYIALSFVRRAVEVADLRSKIEMFTKNMFAGQELENRIRHPIRIISKIEKPEALEDIDNIIHQTDGIMVARGDLGVEIPAQRVPVIQDELIKLANKKHKPVIVATQMLESMMQSTKPTRAEVSDVASAAFQNTDAVMLSGETASGNYPVEAVNMMDSVLREVEFYKWSQKKLGRLELDQNLYSLPDALSRACTLLSQDMEIRALNFFTQTSHGPKLLSSLRPNAPIFAYCINQRVVNQMSLYWGIKPILVDRILNLEEFIATSIATVKKAGIAKSGQQILVVSPVPERESHNSHSIVVCDIT